METFAAIHSFELFATLCFLMALLHTFSVKQFRHLAHRFPNGSVGENFFHLMGEVEVIFGIWSLVFLIFFALVRGLPNALQYLESLKFNEPIFVFVVMTVCSTKPILEIASWLISEISRILPFKRQVSFYFTCLTVGPLLGSFITEPAAMTVTAMILMKYFYQKNISLKFKYATIGLLFVNVSIGGTLTPYAAPPVLMVASKWGWDLNFMFTTFGWKALVSILLTTTLISWKFNTEITRMTASSFSKVIRGMPLWVPLTHLLFLMIIVLTAHHITLVVGAFLFFLGLTTVTKEYQDDINLRDGLLVGFFLGGLIVIGGPQSWWLEPLLTRMNSFVLFIGGLFLTAITDNAALTYLGSQVPNLSEESKYALVAGSVVGGGLTVIANAPNPAGYGILNPYFGEEGINPLQLFLNALLPTLISALIFWIL